MALSGAFSSFASFRILPNSEVSDQVSRDGEECLSLHRRLVRGIALAIGPSVILIIMHPKLFSTSRIVVTLAIRKALPDRKPVN